MKRMVCAALLVALAGGCTTHAGDVAVLDDPASKTVATRDVALIDRTAYSIVLTSGTSVNDAALHGLR